MTYCLTFYKDFCTCFTKYFLRSPIITDLNYSPLPSFTAIELLGQDKRVLTTAFLGIMLVIGGLAFALLAKTFRYWRTFILVAYPPSLLFLSYLYLLPESIRWLLSKGRKEEAAKIIHRAAEMNGVTLSDETLKELAADDTPTDKVRHVIVSHRSIQLLLYFSYLYEYNFLFIVIFIFTYTFILTFIFIFIVINIFIYILIHANTSYNFVTFL